MHSKLFSWSGWDYLKAAVMAALGVILSGLYTILTGNPPHFPVSWADWSPILVTGASAFIGYLLKTLFTNSAGQLLKSESTPEAIAVTKAKADIANSKTDINGAKDSANDGGQGNGSGSGGDTPPTTPSVG